MFQFKSTYIKTDVTAIKIFKNHTFIGIGTTLHIFCNKSNQLINKVSVEGTRGEQIFGIEPFVQNKLFLFGGQFLILFAADEKYTSVNVIRSTTYPDWILEAKLIDNETKIATVSMQNKLQIWDENLKLLEVFECAERCILYSAHLCYRKYEDLIILSGTVFNEVLIWNVNNTVKHVPVHHRLKKHEGVIFSIHYNEQSGLICSTSDDRSAILWKVNKLDLRLELKETNPNIFPVCQVYGHLSRVFRCITLDDCFITAGEDSLLKIWTLEGKLIRKVETHQNSPIWALDYDKNENVIITGGGNGGVYTFSLKLTCKEEKLCLLNKQTPKLVVILASNNIAVFSENAILYLSIKGEWVEIKTFEDLKSYALLKTSPCRKLIALAGFTGQIYIYKEFNETLQNICQFQSINTSRIISLHWLTCDLILTCQDGGKLTLLYLKLPALTVVASFLLPSGSQKCSTTATIFENTIVVGDRKGNIYRYEIGKTSPIQKLFKVHNHLGVTKLVVNKNKLISLGRNSVIKKFSSDNSVLSLITSDKVPYNWLLDVIDDLIIAFSGDNFVIYNYNTKRLILDKVCGGGHRCWDFSKTDSTIIFLYIKDKCVNKLEYDFNINKSYDLVEPFHLKEVNTMQILKSSDCYILISGGEDTTLRISLTDVGLNTFTNLITLKSHLSSIRCVTKFKLNNSERFLIFSAGGRAQIVCWTLNIENNVKDLTCKENHSYYEVIDCEESETRIMDLCAIDIEEQIILFAACSDGYIKVFYVEYDTIFKLSLYRNIFYKLKCIFKVFTIRVLGCNILVTAASDGNIVFWNINDFFVNTNTESFGSISVHQSGINTISNIQIYSDSFLFLTAGDDNTVALNYVKFKIENEGLKVQVIDKYLNAGLHWAQITGTFINNQYFLTASVDQRLILYKWWIKEECLVCEVVAKYNSSLADIKGLICFNNKDFDIFIYGLGIECLKLVNK